jgi:flagellar motility protein MotE (MotC chaperone)
MPPQPPPTARKSAAARHGWAVLPGAAIALLLLAPLRATSLAEHWSAAKSAGATQAGGVPPAQSGAPVVALPDGVTARTLVSATLAGGPRPAPVGDDRPADGRLLAEVARRQAELDRREHDLDTRSAQVAAAQALAKQQIAELTKLRTQIEGLVSQQTGAADTDLVSLVGLYQNMKPQQAAAVLGKMDPPQAGLIIQRLGDRVGGPILAAMEPAAALAVTEDIARRRAAFRQ